MKKGVRKHQNNDVVPKLKAELDILKRYLKKDVSLPIVASFGFIIALVWRDAIRATLDRFLSRLDVLKEAYVYEIVSAVIVTILIMIIMIAVTEFSRSRKTKKIGKEVEKAKRKIKNYADKKK